MNGTDSNRLEERLGRLLNLGSVAASILLAAGLAGALLADQGLSPRLLDAGLLVLMLTPVARVIVSLIDYALGRDWTFTALTAAVLAVLIGSWLAP